MSLVNRVSAFFLVFLGIVLIVYSALFYGLVRRQLEQQFDQQLHGALHTLVAAIEVEIDDVKWEPSDHTIGLGVEDGLEDVRWTVYDEAGRLMDQSRNLAEGDATARELTSFGQVHQQGGDAGLSINQWRVLQRRLAAPQPKPVEERDPQERSAIVVTVGRSTADLSANLRSLALFVCLLPLLAWLSCAALVRWYCATALAPVRQMASQARSMTDANFSIRLPISSANDELADLSKAFNSLLDQLAVAFTRQERFAGDAAHQLRTPLTALLGQIEVAMRRPRPAEEYVRTLTELRDQTREMQQVVEGMLYLARPDTDSPAGETQSVNLADWLSHYLTRWAQSQRNGDLQLVVPAHAVVTTSPALLAQLLDNLISNAMKYSSPGTPITVTVAQHGEQIGLEVADRGQGIAPDELTAIFEPFYRSPQARLRGIAGTGLGLAIAKRISVAIGGELTCRSTLGSGSALCLLFGAPSTAENPAQR